MIRLAIGLVAAFWCFTAFGDSYQVDAKASQLLWVGEKVTGKHDGTIDIKSGEFTLGAKGAASGKFFVDMKSIKCTDIEDPEYNGKLVGHLKSPDFFDVGKYPMAKFELKSAKKISGNTYSFSGNLTIKKATNPLTFKGKLVKNSSGMTLDADVVFDRSKFDIRYNSKSFFDPAKLGDKLIYNNIKLKLKIAAKKKGKAS